MLFRGGFSSFTSKSPSRIHTFDNRASEMVSAFRDDRRSVQMWHDFENTRSTETLVAGIAKKSLAMRAGVEKDCAFFWERMSPADGEYGDNHTLYHVRGLFVRVEYILQVSNFGKQPI